MDVDVTYGEGWVGLNIPEKNLAGVIEPKPADSSSDVLFGINKALDNPEGPHLSEISRSKSVCILVEDHTRDAPHEAMVSGLVPRVTDADRVQFIITTGSHEVNHPGNLEIVEMIRRVADEGKLSNYDILIHEIGRAHV